MTDYKAMKYPTLRELAKERGIRTASMSTEALREALRAQDAEALPPEPGDATGVAGSSPMPGLSKPTPRSETALERAHRKATERRERMTRTRSEERAHLATLAGRILTLEGLATPTVGSITIVRVQPADYDAYHHERREGPRFDVVHDTLDDGRSHRAPLASKHIRGASDALDAAQRWLLGA